VKALAEAAGIEVPAPSPEHRAKEEQAEDAGEALARAAAWWHDRLVRPSTSLGTSGAGEKARELLAARGVDDAAIAKFGLGFAPRAQSIAGCGVAPAVLAELGLMIAEPNGFADRFRQRIMIPIHDARGRGVGFGGRTVRPDQEPKFVNSPESAAFDKGRLLYNLHRAAAPARAARRLVIVEGYFDVIALDQAGVPEAVAPMGTALTEAQLERAWRVHHCPILLLDGDGAGRKAALRGSLRAMPLVGPGASLQVAQLPEGEDPDSFVRAHGRDALEAVLAAAQPLSSFVFDRLMAEAA
jgi:DNA primase